MDEQSLCSNYKQTDIANQNNEENSHTQNSSITHCSAQQHQPMKSTSVKSPRIT